jgi:CheY-like chemotaxis protein
MGLRILVVEDEKIVAADLEVKLQRMGHQVVGKAASGEEAIQLAQELKPGLVLMDVRLQGNMDGSTAAQKVQEITEAPVIFITAYPEIFLADPAQMRRPGICLSKPFSTRQLEAALESVVEARS